MSEIENFPQRGTIKIYFPLKEYGFITRKRGSDLFFLRSSFADEFQIAEGALVEFMVESTARGLRAISIRRIS